MSNTAEEQAKDAEFEKLNEEQGAGLPKLPGELEVLLDVPVKLSLEVGKTSINIRNLLELNQGSIIELDKEAGEPLDVLINGTLIAHAEVVVINEKFGLRLTDVVSTSERIEKVQQ